MNTLTCIRVRRAIEAMQPLSPDLHAHADDCATCQTVLQGEMATRALLMRPADKPVPAGFSRSVMRQIETVQPPVASRFNRVRSPLSGWILPAAAAAVFVLLWVNTPMFTNNPMSNRLTRMSAADDWMVAYLEPSEHDLLDFDPTDVLTSTVDF